MEPIYLKQAGAKWYHTKDWEGPNLSKASLGLFFQLVISEGAHIGHIWCMNFKYPRSAIHVSVFMTEKMKNSIESKSNFKFIDPPKVHLN